MSRWSARPPGIVRSLAIYDHVPGLAYWRAIELEVWDDLWRVVQPRLPEGMFLDLACGSGLFTSQLHLPQPPVGIDLLMETAAVARQSGQYRAVIVGDACHLPFPTGLFSYVFSNSSLEHVRGLIPALAEVKRILCPGGLLAFVVPTTQFVRALLRPSILQTLGCKAWAERVRERILSHTDTYNRLSTEEWCQQVAGVGLHILEAYTFMPASAVRLWEMLHYLYTKPVVGVRLADVVRNVPAIHRPVMQGLLHRAVRWGKRRQGGVQLALVAAKPN